MTTENDLGAAAALFHLHSSPLVAVPAGFLNLNMPSLTLPGQTSVPSTAGPLQFPISASASSTVLSVGRPRSQSWAPGPSSLSLLSLLQGESDTSAAGTLCALMKSASPSVEDTSANRAGNRPRSQSMSAAATLQQQQTRLNKGLRPRSTSMSSAISNPTIAGLRRSSRPRSYSQSSRVSARSLSSHPRSAGRRRAGSLDSAASFFDDIDDEFDSEDFEEGEAETENNDKRMSFDDELHRVGAYSPASRRKRIEKFIEKRQRRIWRKRIKYDVRKNFADSRLRVKGRFVRKEDEEQLREYLQLT